MGITADVWLSFGAVMALLGASAFFSCTEIAVFSVLENWEARDDSRTGGGRNETALAALRSDPHRLLVTLLVGNTLVNIAISSPVTVVLVGLLPGGLAADGRGARRIDLTPVSASVRT